MCGDKPLGDEPVGTGGRWGKSLGGSTEADIWRKLGSVMSPADDDNKPGAEIDLSTVSSVASIFLSDFAIMSVLRFERRPRCDSSKMHYVYMLYYQSCVCYTQPTGRVALTRGNPDLTSCP